MEAIFGAIHGTYAYLLILQIVVVTMLFLTLLWLVVKRTRDGLYAGAERSVAENAAGFSLAEPAAAAAAYAQAGGMTATQTDAESAAPMAAAPVSAGDADKLRKLEEEKLGLAEKVKFLESKLLEYEILQEEIGALGALKQENEKLKQRLVAIDPAGTTNAAAPTPTEAAPAEPEGHSPKELAEQLASAFDSNVVFTESTENKPVTEAAAPAEPAPGAPVTEPAKKQANLDDLLSQIDSLTSNDR